MYTLICVYASVRPSGRFIPRIKSVSELPLSLFLLALLSCKSKSEVPLGRMFVARKAEASDGAEARCRVVAIVPVNLKPQTDQDKQSNVGMSDDI